LVNILENFKRVGIINFHGSLFMINEILGGMAKDPTFVDSVIDEFADKKDRRIELS